MMEVCQEVGRDRLLSECMESQLMHCIVLLSECMESQLMHCIVFSPSH